MLSFYMISLSPLPTVCLLWACSYLISSLHIQEHGRERRNTGRTSVEISISKSSLLPKAANNKVPTVKVIQHYPKPPLSVSSTMPQKPQLMSLQWKLPAPIRLDLTPYNSSGRPKTRHSSTPPFQTPSLSPPYFHHVIQLSLPCFRVFCQELLTIDDLSQKLQSSLKNHQKPPRLVWISSDL